jgi:hypothetical protein
VNFISTFAVIRGCWKVEELLLYCAARIALVARAANWVNDWAGCGLRKHGVEIAKVFLKFAEMARIDGWLRVVDGQGKLRFFLSELAFEDLPGAGDCIALVVEEALDTEGHLDVTAAIKALASSAFVGFEVREFTLPEAQNVGWDVAEFGDFTNAEIELVRNVRPGCGGSFADWLVLCHAIRLQYRYAGVVMYRPASGQYRPTSLRWIVIFPSAYRRNQMVSVETG